jgi:F-type H+-transporting ATPase subunit delta
LSVLAQRYAAALADVALERKNPAAVKRELASFAGAYQESADLRNFLASPAVDFALKHSLIEKLAEEMDLSLTVRNFLFLLVDNRRAELLREILPVFEVELNSRLGIAEAQVTSARELAAEEKKELMQALERVSGKKIEARYSLDESLLGGAVVQIGSTIYDGSVREQLERLRARLEAE